MSKGPGKLQREIAALIAAEPDGAWTYEHLASLIYGSNRWTRAQKSAVGRAITAMKLPGTWTVGSFYGDRRWWLYDECNLASVRKTRGPWIHKDHFEPGGMCFEQVEKAKRWRDGSPIERIDMQIADLQQTVSALRIGGADREAFMEVAERTAALKAERDKLEA